MLTAAEVEQKTFSTALRGYDLDEVDDFLDEIVATVRELTDQLDAAREGGPEPIAPAPLPEPEPEAEIEAPEPQPEVEPELEKPAIDEGAIGRALIAAQTAADQLLVEAEGQAARIVDDAKSEAENWEAEKEAKREAAEADIARFTERVASVRSELAVLAGEVSVKLDDMDAAIEGRHSTTETAVAGGDDGEDDDGEHDAIGAIDVAEDDSVDEFAFDDESDDMDDEYEYEDSGGADSADADGGSADEADEDSANGDHLDQILDGVASDLQLSTDDDDASDEESDEESDEDE